MDTTNLNGSVTNINKLGFDQIWGGAYFTNQRDSLNDAMTKLTDCIADVNEFNNALIKLEEYIKICERIQELYRLISSCASSHTKEQDENGCGACSSYYAEITQKESQRKLLRAEIIAMLSKFTGVDIEIAEPADYKPDDLGEVEEPEMPDVLPNYDPLSVTNPNYDGSVLSPSKGRNDNGPQGCETWYDLPMDFVVERMGTVYGKPIETWVDPNTGIKMCREVGGDGTAYVMVAADTESVWGNGNDVNPDSTYHMGDIVQTSWGPGMVVDYCELAVNKRKSGRENHFDIATAWGSGYYDVGQQAAAAANEANSEWAG